MKDLFNLLETQQQLFDLDSVFNAAPGFEQPIVVKNSPNHIEVMQWGLVPLWAKDIRIASKMIHARAETLLQQPSFKKPFMNRRCVIPVSGLFEWKITLGGRIPYYIKVRNADVFGLAGLFEIAHDADGKELKTFTIIAASPNEFMAEIHDRMPVIIPNDTLDYSLDTSKYEEYELLAMLIPFDVRWKNGKFRRE